MATSKIQKDASRTWTLIASEIGATDVPIDVSKYSEVLMILYNTSLYFVNSAVYPVSYLNGHLANVYNPNGSYYLRIKDNGTKAVVDGGGVFYGMIFAR